MTAKSAFSATTYPQSWKALPKVKVISYFIFSVASIKTFKKETVKDFLNPSFLSSSSNQTSID